MARPRRQRRRHPDGLADRRQGRAGWGLRARPGSSGAGPESPRAARIRSTCARNQNCRSTRRSTGYRPLADRMRPRTLAEFTGQAHLLAPGRPLHRLLTDGVAHSMVLWGPPGSGKTTLARLAAARLQGAFHRAVGGRRGRQGHPRGGRGGAGSAARRRTRATVLFLDEVHRFNKAQQDTFLPFVEDGTLVFIGATTENPSFELNSALLSRARVYLLKALAADGPRGPARARARGCRSAASGRQRRRSRRRQRSQLPRRRRRRRRAARTQPARGGRATSRGRGGRCADRGDRPRGAAGGASALRQARRAVLRPDLGAAQVGARQRRGRCALLALPHAGRRLRPGLHRAPAGADGERGHRQRGPARAHARARGLGQLRSTRQPGGRTRARAGLRVPRAARRRAMRSTRRSAPPWTTSKSHGTLDVPLHLRNAPTRLMQDIGYGQGYRYAHDEPDALAPGPDAFPGRLRRRGATTSRCRAGSN